MLNTVSLNFLKVRDQKEKKQFYECGFKSITDLNIQFNVNFLLICAFLVIYDVEFIFLYPALFKFNLLNFTDFFVLFIFLFFLLIAVYYDYRVGALNWQL